MRLAFVSGDAKNAIKISLRTVYRKSRSLYPVIQNPVADNPQIGPFMFYREVPRQTT